MNFKNVLIVVLVAAALGYAFGRYLQPAKVEVKKEVEVKEIEVVKRDVVVVTKEIKRPDGTVEKETRTEDRSTETVKKDSHSKESTVVQYQKPQWKVDGSASLNRNLMGPVYGVSVERRVLGPIFAGVRADTDKQVGIVVGIEF